MSEELIEKYLYGKTSRVEENQLIDFLLKNVNEMLCICNKGLHDGKRIDCGCKKCNCMG